MVTFVVVILLPGLTVLVFCVSLPLSSVPCIGQRVLMTLDMGHFGVSSVELLILFEKGLDTGCFVKR